MDSELLGREFLAAQGAWRGCDWDTRFGTRQLNLKGLRAEQTRIIARATAGAEAALWDEAAVWLGQVEQDALAAEREAVCAMHLALEGRGDVALGYLSRACAIESHYPEHRPVWEAVRRLLEAAPLPRPKQPSLPRCQLLPL